MPDPIQSSSSIPLPSYQTIQGSHDPLPVSSPRSLDRSAATRAADDGAVRADAFKSYLDQTSITVVERAKPKVQADVVDLINAGNVYAQPGTTMPL